MLQKDRGRRSLTPPTHLSRTGTLSRHSNPASYWTEGQQTQFEAMIARLTASAGFSLRWIDDPEWIRFCSVFVPDARLISRKTLTQRLIPSELAMFQEKARGDLAGELGTVQEDGWTGMNKINLLAFMVNAKRTVQ